MNKSVVNVVTFMDCSANGPENMLAALYGLKGVLFPVVFTE